METQWIIPSDWKFAFLVNLAWDQSGQHNP